MSIFKRILVFVLVLAMCSQMAVPALAANSLGTTYTATIDKPTIYVSSEKQTITVTIKTNAPVDLDSITAQALTPAGLKLTGIANETLGFTSDNYNLDNGKIAWYLFSMSTDYKTTDTLAVLTYEVPANTPADTYVIDFNILNISNNFGTTWENGTTVSATLTIGACAHADTTTTTVEKTCDTDGSVTVTCDDCGETISTTVIPAGHTESTKEETTPATCTEEGKRETVTFCTKCGKELGRVTTETLPAGHTWGTPTYSWTADCSSCTAARSCTVCDEGEEEETVNSTSAVTEAPTCGVMGSTTYTADFAAEWAETQTQTVQNVPATGAHSDRDGDSDHDCDVCGEKNVSECTPAADDGDCTTAIYCTECGEETTAAKTHDYQVTGYTNDGATHTVHYACENDGCKATKDKSSVPHDHTKGKCVCGEKATPAVTAPTPVNGLVYNGDPCCLIDAGETDRGRMVYSLNEDGPFIPDIPTATDAGDYTVYYYVEGDENTYDSEVESVDVTISPFELTEDNTTVTLNPDSFIYDGTEKTPAITVVATIQDTNIVLTERTDYTVTYTDNINLGWVTVTIEGIGNYTGSLYKDFVITCDHSHNKNGPVKEYEVEPDCVNDGSYDKVVYCSVCNEEIYRETITLPATGHTPDKPYEEERVEPDCTEAGYFVTVTNCAVCNEELSRVTTPIPALGHGSVDGFDYEYNYDSINTHKVICEDCGETTVDKENCAFGDDHICDYCEAIERMTVTFMNGDEVWTETDTEYNSTLGIAGMPIPEHREGHTFGWYTEEGVHVAHGMTVTENLVAYATWTPNTYTVTWKIGSEFETTTSATYGEAITVPTVTVPKNYYGYGWTTEIPGRMPADENLVIEGYWTAKLVVLDEDGNEMQFASGGLSYYPQWKIAKVGETAYANYRGTNYMEGHTLYLVNVADETERYEIIYASGAPVYPSVPMTQNKTLQLTAVPEVYTITWRNADDQIMAWTYPEWNTTPEFPQGQTPNYPVNMMEEGYDYTFVGWSDTKGGEKLDTLPAATGEATYYAVYEKTAKNYLVTWTVDGEWYKETYVAYGASIEAPEYTVPEGYTFSGWQINGPMPAKNITLGATLTINTYTVTWTVDGKTYTTTDVIYGQPITAPAYTAPEGYTFSGWQNIPATMPAKNITMGATLTPNTYTVTWIADGKTFATTEATFGKAIALPENVPTKTGYTFSEWVNVPKTMPANENLTIEAAFTANPYQVTWMANGGSFMVVSIPLSRVSSNVAYDDVITFEASGFNLPVRTGYTFTGWNTKADGTGAPLTAETVMNTTDNLTVYYAQWEVNEYTLSFTRDYGEYELGVESVKVPFGSKIADYLPESVAAIYVNDADMIGVLEFNGIWYVSNGSYYVALAADATMPASDYAVDAEFWFTGWSGADENGWTYIVDSEVLKTGWTEISHADYLENGTGSDWYYLDPETGIRAEGITRVPYPEDAINGNTYAPDQESIDYAASKGREFIDATEAWFWFDVDGKFLSDNTGFVPGEDVTRYAVNGMIPWHVGMVKDENGDYYYFLGDETIGGNILSTGDIHVSRDNTDFGAVKSGIYTFAEDGKLCKYDGITNVNGVLRYYEDAQLMIGAGLVKIGENYIYVRSNGALVVDAEYWVADVNEYTEINVGMAQFDENGFMIIELDQTAKTGVYAENGGWVYYVNGDKQYNAGLILLPEGTNWYDAEGNVVKTADGRSYIYVRSNAQLAVGEYWITNTNDAKPAGKYAFDEYGIAQIQMNGIYLENGKLYFYESNQIKYNAGLMLYSGTSSEGVVYDNDWIYVRSNGQLAIGTYWITNTNGEMAAGKYEFDADGKMKVTQIADGIHGENGKLYYYVNGAKQIGTGLVQLANGKYIYVKTNGELATGNYWVTNVSNSDMSQGMYTFGDDGYLIG